MITHKVSKTSGRESLKLFRRLAVAIVLFFVMQMGWGATYWWIGGSTGNWNDAANWATTEGGAAGTGYPGDTESVTNDEVHIYGDVEVTIASNIYIGKLLISSGLNNLTSDFTTKLSGVGSLNITDDGDAAINLTRCAGSVDNTADVLGTLEINLPVICAGDIQTHSGTTLLVDNGVTLKAKNVIHSAGSGNPISKIQIEGTLDIGTGTLNLNGNNNNGATQLVVTGTVKAGSITFDKTVYNNTSSDGITTKITEPIINNGTIQISNSFAIPNFSSGVTKPYSGNGTIELNGTNATFTNNYTGTQITVATLTGGTQTSTVTGTSTVTDVENTKITTATFNGTAIVENTEITTATFKGITTLNGTNKFTNLTASNLGGKTITINGSQTITNDFALSGTPDSTKLNVAGTGSLSLEKTLIADSLNFTGSGPAVSSGIAYASNSTGTPDDWIVVSGNQYVWKGETSGSENDWHTAQNWLPPSVPSNGDVIINASSTYPIISEGNVTVDSITMNGAATLTVNNSKTLQVQTLTFNDTATVSVGESSNIAITTGCDLGEKITGSGNLILSDSESYSIPDGKTIDINIVNNGTLTCAGNAIFNGSYSGTGSLVASSETTKFNADADLSGGFTHSSGTVVLTATNTTDNAAAELKGNCTFYNLTLNGKVDIKGSNTIQNELSLTSTAPVNFEGDNTIETFTASNLGGKTINFKNGTTQTITSLNLSGTASVSPGDAFTPLILTSDGTWNLDCPDSCADNLQYVSVSKSNSTNTLKVTDCTDGTGNTNWIFVGQEYEWIGYVSNEWNTNINWSPASVPGVGATIIIPAGLTIYPLLPSGGINIADTNNGTITIVSGGELWCNGQPLTVKSITNNGTVHLLGTETISGTMLNGDDNQSGTVEYYGSAATFDFVWDGGSADGKQYANLVIKRPVTQSTLDGNQLVVTGTTKIATETGTVDLSNENNNFGTSVIVGTSNTSAADVTLKAESTQTITIANGAYANRLTIENPVSLQNVTTVGDQMYKKGVTITGASTIKATGTNNAITFKENVSGNNTLSLQAANINIDCSGITTDRAQTYIGAVTLGADEVTLTSSRNITFGSTTQPGSIDGSKSLVLSVPGRTVTFYGEVGNINPLNALSVTGTTNINCASIKTTGDQTYDGAVNLKDGGTTEISGANITFNSTVNGTNALTVTSNGDGKVATFNGNVGATAGKELTSLAVTGTSTINCDSIKTTGTQTYDGEVTIDSTKSPVLTAVNGTTNSTVTFKDSVSTTGTGNKLIVSADVVTENTTSKTVGIEVDVTGSLTNKGTTEFGKVVTVSSSFTNDTDKSATFNENVIVSGDVENNGTVDFKKNIYAYGDVTDNGTWTLSGTDSILVFKGTTAQIFKPVGTTTYKAILIDKSGGSFATDTNVLKVTSFADSATNASAITFATDTTIGSSVEFHTAETVTFTNATNVLTAGTPDTYHDITHTAGLTQIEGTIIAGNITLRNTELTSDATLTAHGDVQFNNGTVNATIDGAHNLTITANDTGKSITFNGNIGTTDTTKLTSLILHGTTNINCASITTTGTQTYDGEVTIDSTKSPVLTAKNGTNNSTVTFKDSVSTIGTGNKLSISTDLITENTTAKTVGIEADVSGTLTNKGTTTFGKVVTVSSSFTNETGKSTTFNENVTVSGDVENNGTVDFKKNLYAYKDVTDNGSWTLSGTDSTLVFTGTYDQKFTPIAATTYKSILIDKTDGSFTTDTNALKVTSFADSATNASTITFATSTTIGSDVVFNTSNDVSFTNTTNVFTAGSPNAYHNITHEKGITNLSGIVTAANITLHKTNLTSATSLIAHGDVEFRNIGTSSYANVYGANDLTITVDTGKSVSFNGDVGKSDNPIPTSLTINGKTNIKCTLISTVGNQVYNGDIAVYSNSTNAYVELKTDATAEVDISGDITESVTGRKLTINTPVLKSTKTSPATINLTTVELAQNVSLNSAVGGGINLSASSISQTAGLSSTLTNNANLSLTSTSIAILPAFENGTSGSLIASSGMTTFKSDVDLSNGAFDANGGTVVLNGTTTSGTSQSLTTKADGSTEFNNLVIKGNVTLNNSNTIATFTAADTEGDDSYTLAGKTITFGAGTTQAVTNMTLKGKGLESNLLTLTSSGNWNINCVNEPVLDYLSVQNSTNNSPGTPAPSTNFVAYNSTDAGGNSYWAFPDMTYTWIGTTSTVWNVTTNWENGLVPTKGSTVIIASTAGNYPKLTGELNLNTTYNSTPVNGSITVNENATFDLADQDLTVGSITNNGLVRLIGSSVTTPTPHTQTISGTMINGDDSTVEYYSIGAATTNFAWDGDGVEDGNSADGKQYANLILNQDTSSSADLVITGNLTINNPATLGGVVKVIGTTTISAGTGNEVNLNNASNVFTDNVKIGDSTTSPAVNAGAVTLKASSPITLANNANADSLTVNSAVKLQNVTTSGNQTYSGTVETITGEAAINSTAGDVSFENPVTLGVQTSVTANGTGKTITFRNAATINGAQALSLSSDGGTTFGADVGGSTPLSALTVTGPLAVNCGIINTSGNQTYKGAVTLGVASAITSTAGDISIESTGSLTINQNSTFTVSTSGKKTDFSGAITGTAKLTTAGSGTVNFNNTVNVASLETQAAKINTGTIQTTGSQNYKGPVTLATATNLTSTTDGNITFDKTLDGAYQITLQVPADKTISVTEQVGQTTAPAVKIMQALSTTFNEAVNISTFTDDAGHTGTVTFAAGGIIQNNVTFNTNNTVSFTGTMNIGAESSRKDLTHATGNTTINGTLNAANVEMADTTTTGAIFATTTQIHNLTLAGDTTITTTGTQTYNGTINDASAGAHTLMLNSGTSQITFASDVGQTAAPKVLAVNGPLAINCAAVTTSDQQNYNAAITSTGAITLKSAALNLNCSTVTTADSQTYDGPVNLLSDTSLTLNTGDLLLKSPLAGAHKFTIAKTNYATFDDTVTVTDFEITLANDTQFANPVAVTNFAITSANDTLFADTLTADSFAISQAANTIFNGAVTIASITDAATAGNISFNAGGTISSATGTSFLTTDTVTFGDNQSDIMTFGSASPYADITHTAGNTSITGLLNAANITLAQTAAGPMTIANSGLFKTIDGAALTYTTSFAQTGTGNSVIGGSFTGNGNASFVTNVQISGTAPADFGSSGTAVSITKNLIILRNTSNDLNINSRVNVTENLVLYKGPVVVNADITAGKDILVLGSTYSTSDTSTGITNEYAYACVRPATWSQPNYTETLLPDTTLVPELVEGPLNDFTATLSAASGTTISAAKNFYANGTVLQTSGSTGQWTLKLPDLTNAASAFAEAYYSEISGCKVICNDGSSTDGTKSRLVCLECDDTGTTNTSNTNVDFDDFEITAAYTERDNAIRVEFNRPLRFNSYTVDLLKFHDSSDAVSAGTNFTGLYADPDCQTPIEIGDNAYDYFYIKAAPQDSAETGAWNTDATGKTSGASDGQSTDRNGKHHTALPCLDFPRALQTSASGQTYTVPFILTDVWGKRLNNYSRRVTKGSTAEAAYGSANSSNDLLDKTGPVLWKVRTGQELHNAYDTSTGQASEHSYDAHNFIEFLYSEKVDFDGSSDDSTLNDSPATAENVQVNDSLGAVIGDITKSDNLKLAGLGTIQNGLLWTGSAGVTSKEVNALYRKGTKAEYSIRLSIAGYTEGIVTDPDGNTYKKWIGYIEKAQMPTGTVTHIADSNTFVKDKEGNPQIKYEALNMIPEVDSTEDGLYGKWDLSEPVFAPVRQNKKTAWASQLFQKDYQAEAVGNNSGVGSTLDRIEFHLYDNTPEFDDDGNAVTGTPEWFSEVGWCALGSDGEKATDLYKAYTYAADIFGGARPFDSNTQRRTQGGIRYSTLHSAVNAFKYGINSGLSESNVKTSFDNSKNTWGGASSLIFTGSSSPRRSAGDLEGLYFALPLANTSLDIKTSFTIKYDEKTGFVTDLAGNRLRTKIISTIDRTPPSIDMTVCPVGGDDLQIIFVKELCTDSRELNYIDGSGTKVEITEDFESLITECIDFIKIDSSGSPTVVSNLKIDNTSPAVIEFEENQNGSFFTKIKFKLNRKVTLEDVKNTFIRIIYTQKYGEYSVDLFTGHSGSRVTFIQDENGNNIQMYTAHALSDFAVGVIDPLYAYDSAMTEEDGTIISDSLLHQNRTDDVDRTGWSVHDWNRDQKNYGTLPAKRPLAIVADTTDGTLENTDAPASFRLYLSNNPDKDSVSTQYNKDLEPDPKWRIWLPNEMTGVFTSLSEKNNTNYSQVDGSLLSDDISNRLIFDIGQSITNLWAAGNQISFLFGLTNSDGTPVTIMHSPELDINNDKQYLPTSAKMPLFALRQTEPDDLLSLDLWSFRLKDVVSQRGGVTILNNVINSSQREKVVVKVNQPQQGNLTVLVMTLDGSIVDYLHRGSSEEGEHFYSWDGSNRRGHSVARGMYFIRVTGPGIDETRKVMVVKD